MSHRSNKTQVLMNYFDSKFVRTRENPYAIDAQILNTAATLFDDADIRYKRELKGLQLPYCPTSIDNNGVYYRFNLDSNYSLSSDTTTLNNITGSKSGNNYTLTPYDDLLPVPAGYSKDPLRNITKVDNPILTSIIGQDNVPVINYKLNISLPIVNTLTFWLSDLAQPFVIIDVVIYGVKYPQNPWINSTIDTENIQITSEGIYKTLSAWVSISKIVIRNLPANAKLDCYSIAFNIPASFDEQRPAAIPAFRDRLFDKYWEISIPDNLLKEVYRLDNLTGLVYYQSYKLSSAANCLAVEPNTWGLITGSGTILSYLDRREPMPNLSNTGLTIEPCYGLDVIYNVSYPGGARNILIRPIPYAKSSTVSQYRILINLPNGTLVALLNNNSYLPYSSSAGWRSGIPQTTNLTLYDSGQYNIVLECLDSNGQITSDIFPYNNLDVSTITRGTYDLSSIIINIEAISYDFLGNLWVYDGSWAIPIKPYYHGYILDPLGRQIYLTDKWDQVVYN